MFLFHRFSIRVSFTIIVLIQGNMIKSRDLIDLSGLFSFFNRFSINNVGKCEGAFNTTGND